MKHLLILISFLLLSSLLTSCEKKEETLYRWKNPSGDGYIWKGFGDKDIHQKYQGQVKDGKPNGQGTNTYPLTGVKYVGEFKDGKKHGQGTWTYPNGTNYVGEFKDGIFNGQGTFTRLYKGKFNGEIVGEWKDGFIWNGTTYDKDGKIKDKWVNGEWIKP
jgi:hypothetical protein